MFPWKSVIQIQASCATPVYVQIANGIICQIREGRVRPGAQLPGTRAMSEQLQVHRKTMVAAYEELDAQGWIDIKPSKGAFINGNLPEMQPVKIAGQRAVAVPAFDKTGFEVNFYGNIHTPAYAPVNMLGLHDGPDLRLVPTTLIARTLKGVMTRKTNTAHYRHNEVEGNQNLRQVLSAYLNESRGLQTTPQQVFITRGCQMAIFLAAMSLLQKEDYVVTGDPSYYYADSTFTHFGAKIIRASVDENGLQTEAVEAICKQYKIRLLYVTPHHHYPTTVTLSAARRMELLALSERYGFAILEDDYDYDFHYQTSPILPLASADKNNMVVYVGSLSKTFAPALRVGFLVAPENLMSEIGKMRQIVDVQGDWMLEQAFAELFRLGEIKRHIKKALKIYRLRRDLFCGLMEEKLGDKIQFKRPEGGMAAWVQFDPAYPLTEVAEKAKKVGLIISNGLINDKASTKKWNAARFGFAGVNEVEIRQAVGILGKIV